MAKSEKWYAAIRKANSKHGYSNKERLYETWCHIRQRCNNPNDRVYPLYGGRGIKVCGAWMSDYQSFRNWAMDNGYREDLTLDRIDNNGDYCPENCRWVDRKTQANNRRTNRLITYNGITHTLSEWSEITGIKWCTILARINKGWSTEKALYTPVRRGKCES